MQGTGVCGWNLSQTSRLTIHSRNEATPHLKQKTDRGDGEERWLCLVLIEVLLMLLEVGMHLGHECFFITPMPSRGV